MAEMCLDRNKTFYEEFPTFWLKPLKNFFDNILTTMASVLTSSRSLNPRETCYYLSDILIIFEISN